MKQKKGYKIRLDLTKKCYLMLSEANKLTCDNQNANFCCADVSCRLKLQICWNDNQEDFFETLEDLRDSLDRNWEASLYIIFLLLSFGVTSGKVCILIKLPVNFFINKVCEVAIKRCSVELLFCIFVWS